MRCPRCSRPLITFRLNPARGRVEPFCTSCNLAIELPPLADAVPCPHCGTDFGAVRALRLLGCEYCYDTFADSIKGMLQFRRPTDFFYERESPSSLALSRLRILQDLLVNTGQGEPALSGSGDRQTEFVGKEWVPPALSPDRDTGRGLSLRIRLARNIPGLPYPGRMNDRERSALDQWLFAPGASLPSVIQRLCSGQFHRRGEGLTSSDGLIQLWSGDEDHFRLSRSWNLDRTERTPLAELVDSLMEAEEDFLRFQEAFDREFFWQARPLFGFLAACPSNSGSGRRVSLQFSTRSLESQDPSAWLKWKRELKSRARIEVRGSQGEGSPVAGRVTILFPDELPGRPDHEERRRIFSEGLRLYNGIRQAVPIMKKE